MKFAPFFVSVFAALFLANCSTHPEIKPYEASKEESTSEEALPHGQTISDSVFSDSLDSDEMPTEFDDSVDMAEEEGGSDEALEMEIPAQKEIQKAVVQKVKKSDRTPASVGKGGMFTFKADCVMKAQPNETSENAGNVSAGKKLWLDAHDSAWFKAYKKAGTVFVPATCVK